MKIKIIENEKMKALRSDSYNFNFNKKTGEFIRWGETMEDDPVMGLPEIADIEISTACDGVGGKRCEFCYKSSTGKGKYMTFETFKQLFSKLPKSITQIAFGSSADGLTNPDVWKIMDHCRENGVIPNITIADISDDTADKLAERCGAVAVSVYEPRDFCYDSVKKLTDRGMDQVNIHCMISEETFDKTKEVIDDIKSDSRLEKLNAIVFLSLKKKGRGICMNSLTQEKFNEIVEYANVKGVRYGFDSCSAPKYLKAIENDENFDKLSIHVEPCESSLFSSYFSTDAKFYACSFCEGEGEWKDGIDVIGCDDFIKDVWFSDKVNKFRKKLLSGCRNCPMFDV